MNLAGYHTLKNLVKKISQNVFLLSQLRFYMNSDCRKLFFHAPILSHLNYASTAWSGAAENYIKKLNSLHRRGIKLVSSMSEISSEEKMAHLEIRTLRSQFSFNTATLMYRTINYTSPPYLLQLLNKVIPTCF